MTTAERQELALELRRRKILSMINGLVSRLNDLEQHELSLGERPWVLEREE